MFVLLCGVREGQGQGEGQGQRRTSFVDFGNASQECKKSLFDIHFR